MSKPKVLVAGGSDFKDYDFLKNTIDSLNLPPFEIVLGACKVTDELGKKYAEERGLGAPKIFTSDKEKYGKAAVSIKNEDMILYADGIICFWDGESRGMKRLLEIANRYALETKIINYNQR